MQAGDAVKVEIDAARRRRLMRLHFGAEMVLELTVAALQPQGRQLDKIGAHIGEQRARIDFLWPEPLTPLLPELQQQAQSLIDQDLPIETGFSDLVNERRFWRVAGFAEVACGGTHLSRTGEVGGPAAQAQKYRQG